MATPTYDANGNTLSDGTNTHVWNERNQLASMNLTSESFQYDPLGRRVAKTILGTTMNLPDAMILFGLGGGSTSPPSAAVAPCSASSAQR